MIALARRTVVLPVSGFSTFPDSIYTGCSIWPAPSSTYIRSIRLGAPLSFQYSFTSIP